MNVYKFCIELLEKTSKVVLTDLAGKLTEFAKLLNLTTEKWSKSEKKNKKGIIWVGSERCHDLLEKRCTKLIEIDRRESAPTVIRNWCTMTCLVEFFANALIPCLTVIRNWRTVNCLIKFLNNALIPYEKYDGKQYYQIVCPYYYIEALS